MKWKKYYVRVIGMFLSGGGLALIGDEILNGPLDFSSIFNHEVYGVALFVLGLILVSIKPKGKEENYPKARPFI